MKKNGRRLAAVIILIGVWAAAAGAMDSPLLLPGPFLVVKTLVSLMGTGTFWLAVCATLGRVLLGFGVAAAIGAVLAFFTARLAFLRALVSPLMSVARATPVASFILLALVWMVKGTVPVFVAFVMVAPLVWANVEQGIRETDGRLLEMAQMYGFTKRQIRHLVLYPSVLPYAVPALMSALGMAFKSGVAAEVLCRPTLGMGTALYNAKIYLETPALLAWTAAVVALSMVLEAVLTRISRRVKSW